MNGKSFLLVMPGNPNASQPLREEVCSAYPTWPGTFKTQHPADKVRMPVPNQRSYKQSYRSFESFTTYLQYVCSTKNIDKNNDARSGKHQQESQMRAPPQLPSGAPTLGIEAQHCKAKLHLVRDSSSKQAKRPATLTSRLLISLRLPPSWSQSLVFG